MKKTKPEEFKLSIKKLHKFGMPYDEFFSSLVTEEQEWVEREAKYYGLLM
jgi:hypothetical protein